MIAETLSTRLRILYRIMSVTCSLQQATFARVERYMISLLVLLYCGADLVENHSARNPSTNYPRPLKNGNEGKKKKALNVPHPNPKSSLLRSNRKPRLQAISTKRNQIKYRQVTSVKATLTHSSIRSRLESGKKSTSNKIAK